MFSKLVLRAIAAVAAVVVSAPLAFAGAGAGGGNNGETEILMFQCYVIDGEQPRPENRVVNLTDQFGTRQNLVIGSGRFMCTPGTASKPDPTQQFDALSGDQSHLTCYTVSPFDNSGRRPRLFNPDATVTIDDPLNEDTNVKVGIPAFVCVQASKTCTAGRDCPVAPPAQ
jgi:hypothetical protein